MEKLKKTADVIGKILLGVLIAFLVLCAYNVVFFVLFKSNPNSKVFTFLPLSIPALDTASFGKLAKPDMVGLLANAVSCLWGAVCAFVGLRMLTPIKEGTPTDGSVSRGLYTYVWFAVTGKFAAAILREVLLCVLVSGYTIKIGNVIVGNIQPDSLIFLVMLLMISYVIKYVEESEFIENRKDVRQKMRLEAVNSVTDPIFVTGFELSTVGNMQGSRHVCSIEKNNKGDTRLTTTDVADWNSDPVKDIADVDEAVLAELDVIFRKYRMSFWTSLPTGTHVNDDSTSTYRFKFASNNSEFIFSTKQDLPDDAQTAMKEIKTVLDKYISRM